MGRKSKGINAAAAIPRVACNERRLQEKLAGVMTKQDGRHSKAGRQSRGQTWRGARALYRQNMPVVDIARLLGVSRVRVYQCLRGLAARGTAEQGQN